MEYTLPGMVLFAVLVFCFGLIFLPFYYLNRDQLNRSRIIRIIAFFLSSIVIFLALFAFGILHVKDTERELYLHTILKIALPLATLCGFFILYHNFLEQRKASIRQEMADLILIHKDTLNEIRYLIKKPDGTIIPYNGRSAFVLFLNRFNEAFPSFEKKWLKTMFGAEIRRRRESMEIAESAKFNGVLAELDGEELSSERLAEIWGMAENVFEQTKTTFLNDNFLMARNCKENALIHLYVRMFFDPDTGKHWFQEKYDWDDFQRSSEAGNNTIAFMEFTLPFSGSTETIIVREAAQEDGQNQGQHAEENDQEPEQIDENEIADQVPDQFMEETKENAMDIHIHFGQYFRGLFHIYKRIDEIENGQLQKNVAGLMRAQLSSHEQAVLFLNSLTPLGKAWELDGKHNFFKKYGVIKNIPENLVKPISPWDVYEIPTFEYEFKND